MISLISISVDSPLNMTWWVIKNVLYGSYCLTYYLMYGSKKQQYEKINQSLLLELKKELGELDKKMDIYYKADSNIKRYDDLEIN